MSEPMSVFSRRIVESLTPDLGPHTAQQALNLVCKKAGKTPSTLGGVDIEVTDKVLGRMLRTLLGKGRSARVLRWIRDGAD